MTATRRITDTLIIFALMLLVWQILHQIAGETALPAPLPTMSYLMHMVPTARFAENAAATLKAFALALRARLCHRARHRRVDGRAPAVRRRRRADPGRDLFAAEDHALSGGAAHLRPRHIGQGRVRRHARHPAGRASDHGRDPRHPAGLSALGAHAASVAMANHHDRAAARRVAGSVHRLAHRLHRHAARRAARRDVRVQARPRLHDHDRHVARSERGHGDGRDHPVRLRGDRQCAADLDRAPAASQ